MLKLFRMMVKPELKTRTCLLVLILVLFCVPRIVQGQGKNKNKDDNSSLEVARAYVLSGKPGEAIAVYALLVQKDSTNALLTAEYAYSLALNGIYDAALSRLDRVWTSDNRNAEINFYISQVFALMGCDQLAGGLSKETSIITAPDWIAAHSDEFLERYGYASENATASGEDVVDRFKRANLLTARNYDLQALALFEGIISEYPDEYLPYVGYSIALEQAGMYEESVRSMKKALDNLPDIAENTEARNLLNQRLTSLEGNAATAGKKKVVSGTVEKITDNASKGTARYTAYAGGTFSKSYSAFNARFGTYKPGLGSTSVDLGLGGSGLTLGVTTYYRKKVLVGGFGLVAGLSGGSFAVGMKVSAGISLMNKNSKASWDIFVDGQQTLLPANAGTTMCLSMGRSVYFGKR